MSQVRKISRVKVTWQCVICKIEYTNKKRADECAQKPIEQKTFKKGDRVVAREKRQCHNSQVPYKVLGVISRISRPVPPDEDYEHRWIQKHERVKTHVFEYDVLYTCPRCKQIKRARYYAPEIRKTKREPGSLF